MGKSDFKRILKWRSALLEYHNAQQEPVVAEQPAKVEKTEEEVQLEKEHALKDEIANARLELNKKKKRALKKVRLIFMIKDCVCPVYGVLNVVLV